MIELIVNNISLDLYGRTRIGLTILSSDITSLTTRAGDYTNSFVVPATKKNMEALEFVNLFTSASNLPYRIVKATIIEDGIEIASDAYCVVGSVTNNEITLNVFTGNLDFIKALGDIKVSDLYLDEPSIVWSRTNVISENDPLVFPIINWKEGSTSFTSTADVDARELLPCLKFNDLLDKIRTYSGYQIEDNLTNDIIITPSNFLNDVVSYSLTNTNVFNSSTTTINEGDSIQQVVLTPIFDTPQIGEFASNRFAPTSNTYGTLTFTSKANITWKKIGNYGLFETPKKRNVFLVVRMKDNLGNVYKTIQTTTNTIYLDAYNNPLILPLIVNLTLESPLMVFESGKTYYPEVTAYVSQHDNISSSFYIELGQDALKIANKGCNVLSFASNENVVYGNNLKISNLFDMKVVDVIKEVINSYQIMINTDNYIKKVTFNYLNELITNKNKAIDWSNKIIDVESIGFTLPNIAKRNHLKYKESDDLPNDSNSFFDVSNENLQDEAILVQLSSEMTRTFKGYNDESICLINGINSDYEWQNPSWRILELETKSLPYEVTYSDASGSETNDIDVPFAIFRNFEYLKDNYFNVLEVISIDAKVINAIVRISPLDLNTIRYSFIPVWIYSAKFNIDGYFHVNKIENYKNNTAQVELIRL